MATQRQAKRDADYIFHELTRSICPQCKRVIDAQIIIRHNKVYYEETLPRAWLVRGIDKLRLRDVRGLYQVQQAWHHASPVQHRGGPKDGCPLDCGLCPEHKQHICLALIEVNTGCNLSCPICFANAGPGYSLTMEQVEGMLDRFMEIEGDPEVVQFSGGEPTIHPQILDFVQAAMDRGIRHVMINTNGVRIAQDDRLLEDLARLKPAIYFQFDGLEEGTYRAIRGEDLLDTKLRALERLAKADLDVALVAAVERGINDHEVGAVLRFGLEHPAVRGVVYQPVTHVGRHPDFDPMNRMTIPDVLHGIVDQTDGLFTLKDFVPVPCCFPTCQVNSYALINGNDVIPLPRILDVDRYLDYITNRAFPKVPSAADIQSALEGLWSATAVAGSERTAQLFQGACASGACEIPLSNYLKMASRHCSRNHRSAHASCNTPR